MASKDLTPAPGEIAALLGRGTEFRGKLVFEGRVRIDGHFEGEVHGDGVLVVGEGAVLDGTLDVGSLLVLGGVVRGRVRARELVELHADSHVAADLETPRLFVDKGARFDGQCRMGDGTPSERFPLERDEMSVSTIPSTEAAPRATARSTSEPQRSSETVILTETKSPSAPVEKDGEAVDVEDHVSPPVEAHDEDEAPNDAATRA